MEEDYHHSSWYWALMGSNWIQIQLFWCCFWSISLLFWWFPPILIASVFLCLCNNLCLYGYGLLEINFHSFTVDIFSALLSSCSSIYSNPFAFKPHFYNETTIQNMKSLLCKIFFKNFQAQEKIIKKLSKLNYQNVKL